MHCAPPLLPADGFGSASLRVKLFFKPYLTSSGKGKEKESVAKRRTIRIEESLNYDPTMFRTDDYSSRSQSRHH